MNYHDQIREDAKKANKLLAILEADGNVSIDWRHRGSLWWKTNKRRKLDINARYEFRFTPKPKPKPTPNPTTRPMNYEDWKEYLGTCAFVVDTAGGISLISDIKNDRVRIRKMWYSFNDMANAFCKLAGEPLTVKE